MSDFFKRGKSSSTTGSMGNLELVRPCTELVTPESLLTQFENNYMQCATIQKRGTKRTHLSGEKKVERDLQQCRKLWSTSMNQLLEKEEKLKVALEGTGCDCPDSLLGVPVQQLDRLEKLTFWARMMIRDKDRPSSVLQGTIESLLDDVTALKQRVKKQELQLERLSSELVSFGMKQLSNTVDVITHNSQAFHLEEVLAKNVYSPPFDHNDVFYFFPELDDVVTFYASLHEKCVQERCLPPWSGFAKLMDSPKPQLENLAHGCYIGLMVVTNLADISNNNHEVRSENMCAAVAEQLSGTFLQPGKKYVTWYLGQYSKDNNMENTVLWTQAMDYCFNSIQQCPAAWNSEFLLGWKSSVLLTPGHYKPCYACVLPGTKEVTKDTWNTTDTLDWIVRNVHFWATQLNTYAPQGYNLPLNNHFHRSLFLEIPKLTKFPVLWQYKKSLSEMVSCVSDKYNTVKAYMQLVSSYCEKMKQEFFNCNFNFVFYQWEPVKDMLKEAKKMTVEFLQEKKKLLLLVETLQGFLPSKLCQAEALSSLFLNGVGAAVAVYNQQIQRLFDEASLLFQDTEVFGLLTVTAEDMEALDVYKKDVEFSSRAWVADMCGEVLMTPDTFFQDFDVIKKRVKASRNSHHPDKVQSVDPDLAAYHKFQSWVVQLQAVEKLHEHFFKKCV